MNQMLLIFQNQNSIAHTAKLSNWRFNADANTGHAFGIFMASVGTLRLGLRRRLTWALDIANPNIWPPHALL